MFLKSKKKRGKKNIKKLYNKNNKIKEKELGYKLKKKIPNKIYIYIFLEIFDVLVNYYYPWLV